MPEATSPSGGSTGTSPLPEMTTDTGHAPKHCECGHVWDVHLAVVGGCSVCSCKAHPPNQPSADPSGSGGLPVEAVNAVAAAIYDHPRFSEDAEKQATWPLYLASKIIGALGDLPVDQRMRAMGAEGPFRELDVTLGRPAFEDGTLWWVRNA